MNDSIIQENTIAEAVEYLAEHAEEGTSCPACGQFVKVYRRPLSSTTARVLVAMYRANGDGWVHLPDLQMVRSDEAKARHWNLIQQRPGEREDGSPRTGWWRLTHEGVEFVNRRLRVPKYALIYNGSCLGLEGPPTSIVQCLGTRFNYSRLMEAAA